MINQKDEMRTVFTIQSNGTLKYSNLCNVCKLSVMDGMNNPVSVSRQILNEIPIIPFIAKKQICYLLNTCYLSLCKWVFTAQVFQSNATVKYQDISDRL